MALIISGIETEKAKALKAGALDANGMQAEAHTASGFRNPCRHCLELIPKGGDMLILSYRPFNTLQAYAETGPVFLHAQTCARYYRQNIPSWLEQTQPLLVRGYDNNDRICYETARVIEGVTLRSTCEELLENQSLSYIHVRSKFNCFLCRIDRAA